MWKENEKFLMVRKVGEVSAAAKSSIHSFISMKVISHNLIVCNRIEHLIVSESLEIFYLPNKK